MSTRVIIAAEDIGSFSYYRGQPTDGPVYRQDDYLYSFFDTHIWEKDGILTVFSNEKDKRILCNLGPNRIKLTSYHFQDSQPTGPDTYIEPGQFVLLEGIKWRIHESQ